jgi:hypothetical protein
MWCVIYMSIFLIDHSAKGYHFMSIKLKFLFFIHCRDKKLGTEPNGASLSVLAPHTNLCMSGIAGKLAMQW